jgi:hypothetical protein
MSKQQLPSDQRQSSAGQRAPQPAAVLGSTPLLVSQMAQLQRAIGNQAVQRLVRQVPAPGARVPGPTEATASAEDSGRVAIPYMRTMAGAITLRPGSDASRARADRTADRGAVDASVQRATARAATGAPTRAEPHVFVPETGRAALNLTQGDTVAVAVGGKTSQGALTAKLIAGSEFVAIGPTTDALNRDEVGLTQPTEHDKSLFKLFVKGAIATGRDEAQTPAVIGVFEDGNQVESITVHVWTSIELKAVPWLATVTWNGEAGKPQLGGKDFTTALVMRDAQAYLAPAGINLVVGADQPLALDVDAEVQAAEAAGSDKRRQLEIGIIGALRKHQAFQAAMNAENNKAIHVVFVPTFKTLGYAYPMHMRNPNALEAVGTNWIKDLADAVGLSRAVVLAVEAEYERDTRVPRGGEQAPEEYVTREIGVDVAHEIGHKLSLPHLPENKAPIGLPFQQAVPEQVRLASLVQNLMWEHNPVRLAQAEPSREALTQAGPWLPQTASTTAAREVRTVRGGALSPEQVRLMRESVTGGRIWDVNVELQELVRLLLEMRDACVKVLEADVIGDISTVRRRLKELNVSPYIRDGALNAAASEMRPAKQSGRFDLLASLKKDSSFATLIDTFGQRPPLNQITAVEVRKTV